MQPGTSLRHAVITDCSFANPDFRELYLIFRATLFPGMEFRTFRKYYYTEGFEHIDATFIEQEGKAVGFCAAAFYKTGEGKKGFTLARAATGILADHRRHGLPKWTLYFKYIRYKLHHPFARLVLTGYIANPLVYAMICKYTGIVYPRLDSAPPPRIKELKTKILQDSKLEAREEPEFVVKIHFQVDLGRDILSRVLNSDDVYVRHFLAINPRFQEQYGVLVIIPVTWQNILRSAQKFICNFCGKEKSRWRLFAALKQGAAAS